MSGFQLQETDKVCCIEDVRKYKPYRTADRLSNTNTRRKTCLHTDTHTDTHTHQKKTHTKKFLHTEVFTLGSFYTQNLLHTEPFTHRRFYTQKLLHRPVYTQTLLHNPFTHNPFYTQTLLHTDTPPDRKKPSVFHTRTSFCVKGLPRTLQNRQFTAVFGTRTSFRAKGLPPDQPKSQKAFSF